MSDAGQSDLDWRPDITFLLFLPFWGAHLLWSAWLSHEFFRLSDGIVQEGRLTHYGGIDYSWTSLAWLPGGLLLPSDRLEALGALLMFIGSGFAAYLAADGLARFVSSERRGFGKRWRLWLLLLLWFGWVPVPVKATLTYWYTVTY
jgi:hypothetical protein